MTPTDGPGGPILVVTSSANPFTSYYAEILRAEGLNAFATADVDTLSSAMLSGYDVVLLGDMPLQAGQVSMLDAWVRAGGNLIAMRPDKQLYGLLGLTDDASVLSNKYLGVNTAAVPGAGITGATMPFHGTADLVTSNGAATVATLYSGAATATTHPAVTVRLVGIQGGQAAAFMFDLARSVVYTRQGNPLWAGQDRDANPPVRATDLFIGAAAGDVQPNWNDMNKSHIPHADELQRLLTNVVLYMNRDRKPLPRFWYLPRGARAAVVMTGDEHGSNNFIGRLSDLYNSPVNSPPGCSVDDWQCTRATAYIYPLTAVSAQTIAQLTQQGFEIAMHPTTTGQPGGCTDFTAASLNAALTTQLQQFAQLSGVPPRTSRTHCVVWSDYTTEAEIELQHGIRLDTTYYAWPPEFIQNRPGFFTGAAMPMRFARTTGEMLDIYQAPTQMTDESAQAYPETIQVLIDRALGPDGYFGVFTANMHSDFASGSSTNYAADIVAAARSQQVPIVSAAQMLDWLDGRNQSAFGSIAWNGSALNFTVTQAPGGRGLNALLPYSSGGPLQSIVRDGTPVAFSVETIKGTTYARFPAETGAYVATYQGDTAPPAIANRLATIVDSSTVNVTWATSEPATTAVVYGTTAGALNSEITEATLLAPHKVVIRHLDASTTYYYRAASADMAGNISVSPPLGDPPAVIVMPPPTTVFTDTAEEQFAEGHAGAGTQLTRTVEGEVALAPIDGSEFFGAAMPPGWLSGIWAGGGSAVVDGGELHLNNGSVRGTQLHTAGRSLTFKAAFGADGFQHAGFGLNFGANEPWAIFSTGSSTGQLFARTHSAGEGQILETLMPGDWTSAAHKFRIDWYSDRVEYFVDDSPAPVAVHAGPIGAALSVAASDFDLVTNSGALAIDWMRLTPFAAGGSFDSRVFDAGATVEWQTLTWTVAAPPGTGATFEVRTGDTTVPDATWSAFTPVAASGGAIGRQSRFAQYRATLSTSDSSQTPELLEVSLTNGGALASAALSPTNWSAAAAGETTTALLTINPSDKAWVATSDQPWLTVTPPSGAGSATLTLSVPANPTSAARSATITVAGLTLTVTQAPTTLALTGIMLSQPTVSACAALTATVTLNVPAPQGGAVVAISTTNSSSIVPASVTVAEGQTQQIFNIATVAPDAPDTGVVTATAWNGSYGAPLSVQAARIRSFSFSADSVVGGNSVVATAGLLCAAGAGGVTVEWSSADAALARPLAAVTRIAGGAQTTSVTVATSPLTKKNGTFVKASAAGGEDKKRLTITP